MSPKSVIILSIFCFVAILCICTAKYRRRVQSHSPLRLSNRGKNSKMKHMQRVWYGYKVFTEEYPFNVKVMYTMGDGRKGSCSASIITSKCVLTAAHCIVNRNLYNFDILFISHRLTVVTYIKPEKLVIPKKYNATTKQFDIGLVVLARYIEPEEGQRIPVSIKDYEPNKVRIFGFGQLAPDEEQVHRFRYFTAETWKWKKCNKKTNITYITKKMMCTKWMKTRTAHGDSGGPVLDWENGNQIAVNALVFNPDIEEPWKYEGISVFTRLGHPQISAWLIKMVENNCN